VPPIVQAVQQMCCSRTTACAAALVNHSLSRSLYCGLYLGEGLVELGVFLVADVAGGAQPQRLRAQHSKGASGVGHVGGMGGPQDYIKAPYATAAACRSWLAGRRANTQIHHLCHQASGIRLPPLTWLSLRAVHSVMVSVTFLVLGFFSAASSSSSAAE
jgi:hypothetical protein